MLLNGERALATIRRVVEKQNIPNADRIEAVRVDGWWVVTRKDEFDLGQRVIYLEVDSWVPHHLAPFLAKGKPPKKYNGMSGTRLKTVRLRKQLSQGLLLCPTLLGRTPIDGEDVTAELGVQKWERPIPRDQVGVTRGAFPHFLRKTDQERIQNIPKVLEDLDRIWEVSLKLDGSSLTAYMHEGCPGVCSRNLNLKLSNTEGRFVKPAVEASFLKILNIIQEATGRSFAIQAELIGPGIQGNREKFAHTKPHLFDVWDIDNQRYLDPLERYALLDRIDQTSHMSHVPVLFNKTFFDLGVTDMASALALPEKLGREYFSDWAQPIEGLVFKALDGKQSFKIVNNEFLTRRK